VCEGTVTKYNMATKYFLINGYSRSMLLRIPPEITAVWVIRPS
jgi:hypothetical protein